MNDADKELILFRKMTSAKYDGKKLKYWWLKRKYNKLKRKVDGKK